MFEELKAAAEALEARAGEAITQAQGEMTAMAARLRSMADVLEAAAGVKKEAA
jgi:hypothetical protein